MTAHRPFAGYGLALAALLAASGAVAAETVVSLSPEAKEKVLEAAATRNAKAIGEPAINGAGGLGAIHGEVGMMIGTNGARGVFGSAVAPIGESATVGIAFENSRFGGRR
ncbi:hypothetical protein [Sphingomonas sp. SRS2]|uniref:hypothetical protein n=1 Tax=Sphingomonas sp. SRS2 TaxID=133190 RepID=UPI00061844CA|nr:hypothetical protein [Sphingomonas sp. SRS2]KKC24195.1 hypothetical protein WP12_20615 [Sphingomonas sp. SRS2]